MREIKDERIRAGAQFLAKLAEDCGWKEGEEEDPLFDTIWYRVWVTDHVGLGVTIRGRVGDHKVIIKAIAKEFAYRRQITGWRKLTFIEEEDARSIFELVASFTQKDAAIAADLAQRHEAREAAFTQREALKARVAAFKAATGQEFWVSEYGRVEARDEPYQAAYERPESWIKAMVLRPGLARIVVELPLEGANFERLYKMIRTLEYESGKVA